MDLNDRLSSRDCIPNCKQSATQKELERFWGMSKYNEEGFVGLCCFLFVCLYPNSKLYRCLYCYSRRSGGPKEARLRSPVFFTWNLSWLLEHFPGFRTLKVWNSFYIYNIPWLVNHRRTEELHTLNFSKEFKGILILQHQEMGAEVQWALGPPHWQ